jgi:hypothetical protein
MTRRALALGAVLVALAGAAYPALAQDLGRYYPETGHTLDTRFVEYFDEHGSLAILGYPITNSFLDPTTGWLVQYFQNARVELAPDATGALEPRLSPLGEYLGGWQPPLAGEARVLSANPGCRFYPESGHSVCHAFLDFYDRNGGPAQFGFPISEFRLENDRIVQYFQGFRLDWYPDDPLGSEVRVAALGRLQFEVAGYDRALLRPNLPFDMIFYRVVDLRPRAAVWKPVVQSTDSQHVYLTVHDQNLNPVSGAAVTLIAHFPTGDQIVTMPITDEQGVSQVTLTFEGQPAGSDVNLEFRVVRGEMQASTRDSFKIWW